MTERTKELISTLRPGDCLLYKPSGFFGRIIWIKTWHKIGHVEVYNSGKFSIASRDGEGVDDYPVRTNGLVYVLRPTVPLNHVLGWHYFSTMRGAPYGWLDLLSFSGWHVDTRGIVCSPFAAGYYRACGWKLFPTDPINKIAPFQFLDLVGHGMEIVHDFTKTAKGSFE